MKWRFQAGLCGRNVPRAYDWNIEAGIRRMSAGL